MKLKQKSEWLFKQMNRNYENCFVAITRTNETLTLTFAENYNGWSKTPSRFLYEMGVLD